MSTRVSCGNDCTYRRLYEGSQESLSAMAARQTEALSRVGTLRAGMLEVLKQTFPVQYAAAERQMGRRLHLVDDEVLLAFVRAFIAPAAQQAVAPGSEELRAALIRSGVQIPEGYNLQEWAQAVMAMPRPAVTTPAAPADAAASPEQACAAVPAVTPVSTAATADLAAWDDDWTPPPFDGAVANQWSSGFSGVFDEDPHPAPVSGFASLFDAAEDGPVHVGDVDPDDPLGAVEAAVNAVTREPAGAASSTGPRRRAKRGTPPATPEPAVAPGDATDGQAEGADSPENHAPLAPAPSVTVPDVGAGVRTTAQAFKPELFSAAPAKPTKGRASKTIKVPATRPAARTDLDVPVADRGVDAGTEDDFAAFRDAVALPRPVFTMDLVESTGSHDVVASWERHERSDPNSPVRFIAGNSRHQRRGPLVVPYAADLRTRIADAGPSLWWDLIDEREGRTRLRGNYLYEAAVLAVRFGQEVVEHKVETNLVTMLLNSPGAGMRALVFWTGSQPPAGSDLTAVADAIESRLGARLQMVAVLTAIAGEKPLERLVEALAQEGAQRGWKPTMPIVATHAWEFARDGGASARQIA